MKKGKARLVRQNARRGWVQWVPGVDCSTQQDILIARWHAQMVFQAIQAVLAMACEALLAFEQGHEDALGKDTAYWAREAGHNLAGWVKP